jgi:hypothetical protein
MVLKWNKLSEIEKRQFSQMAPGEKYSYLLSIMAGTPYGWGEENPESADCSGTVCFALMGSYGFRIRTNAAGLFEIFSETALNGTDAYFFERDGKMEHVAGVIAPGVLLNASEPTSKIVSADVIERWFNSRGYHCYKRGINMSKAAKLDAGKQAWYSADKELEALFEGVL